MEFSLEKKPTSPATTDRNPQVTPTCIVLKTPNSHYRTSVTYEIGARLKKPTTIATSISINVKLPPNKLSNLLSNNATLRCREIPPPLGWHNLESIIYHIERILSSAINNKLLHIPLNSNGIPKENRELLQQQNNEIKYIWNLSITINCLNVNEDNNSSCIEHLFYSSLVALMTLELPSLVWDIERGWWVERETMLNLSDVIKSSSLLIHPAVSGIGLFQYIPILLSKNDRINMVYSEQHGHDEEDIDIDIKEALCLIPPCYETCYLITHCFEFHRDSQGNNNNTKPSKLSLAKESRAINLTWLPSFSSSPDPNFSASVKQLHQTTQKLARDRLKLIRKFVINNNSIGTTSPTS